MLTKILTLNDEDVVDRLQALRMANSSVRIYLSGSLTVDFPEEVMPTLLSRHLPAVTVVGDQWGTGVVTVLLLQKNV